MRRREYYWSLYHSTERNQLDNLRTDQVEAVYAAIPKAQHEEWFVWRDGFELWKPFDDFPQLLMSLRKADDRQVEAPPPPPSPCDTKALAGSAQPPLTDDDLTLSAVDFSSEHSGTRMAPQLDGPAKLKSFPPPQALSDDSTLTPPPKAGAVKKPAEPTLPPTDQDFELMENLESELTLMQTGMGEDRNNFRFKKRFEVRIVTGDKVVKNETVDISMKGMQLRDPLPPNLPRYFNVEIGSAKRSIPVVCSEVRKADGKPSDRVRIEVNDYAPGLLAMLLSA